MRGERLGIVSLRLDAFYCVLVGLLVAASAAVSAPHVGLAAPVVATLGVVVVAWGVLVWVLTSRLPLVRALQLVAAANVVAALGLTVVSTWLVGVVVVLTVVVVAVDVAAFAATQGVARRRLLQSSC
ncbi:hypothetical protein FHR75_004082 [Kineococcus radiotolerans]|uniref:Integral membrane protein n=1 Tax=Kineococcus radiotolerans TaxID=131568 RepID=A0A7W4XZD6_KINRA|nr:hypothetical protein [Kineococcus radiotolerans]MBB2903240.1 hypothetical protein [Kineococcus radiotolerans]